MIYILYTFNLVTYTLLPAAAHIVCTLVLPYENGGQVKVLTLQIEIAFFSRTKSEETPFYCLSSHQNQSS